MMTNEDNKYLSSSGGTNQILFLDMDGVLNSAQSDDYHKLAAPLERDRWNQLCPIALSNLNSLLEKFPDMNIVISSAWRHYYPLDMWEKRLQRRCPNIVGRVVGMTPRLTSSPRGHEIYEYLTTHGLLYSQYVILDDDRDMDKVEDHLVQTDYRIGLSYIDVERVAAMLLADIRENKIKPLIEAEN